MHEITNLSYDKDLFIFGEDVLTDIGILRFLTYREFLQNTDELQLIAQNTLHIYYQYKNQLKEVNASREELESLKEIKDIDLYEIVIGTQQILNAYLKIFQLVFDRNEKLPVEQVFSSPEKFHFIRKLIMDMNVITEEKVSPNEEIQSAIERSKRVKQNNSGEKQSFVDIVTSIVASTNNNFEDVCNMNVFQVYAIYARVGAIFNYQTTTLFATVAEKVNIESWNKHIDLFKVEDDSMSKEEFNGKFGSLLKM